MLQFTFEARNGEFMVDTRLGVEIKILDINDHAPVFNPLHYEKTIEESLQQGDLTLIYTLFI